MVKYGRTDCLCHPLCETLLAQKWNRYGLLIYSITTFFYLLFLVSLTLIVIAHPSCIHDTYEHLHEQLIHVNANDHEHFDRRRNCELLVANSYYVCI
jgi:hypothetical protein